MSLERILVVDDELIIRKSIEEILRAKRYSVSSAGDIATAEKLLSRDSYDLMFLDVKLPDGEGTDLLERLSQAPERPLIVMMSEFGTIESVVACMRLGALDYLIKPFSLSQIEVLVKKVDSFRQVLRVNQYLTQEIAKSSDLAGKSPSILQLKELIQRVAPTEATVLVCGENGTGKELVANEIFKASARSHAPYIKINCAAVSDTLIESEFFGHEKGAFTGATDRREGRFELASGGTLLLDEVSEIAPRLQAKLLRVLQEREFERVGGTKTIKVDVRVIGATNRDLKKAVAAGEFREDLYYRLNVFPVHVPPLRDRKEDIPELAQTFLGRFAHRHRIDIPGFSQGAMNALLSHEWPGNVRELQNTIERAVILAEGGKEIQAPSLGFSPVPGDEPVAQRRFGFDATPGATTSEKEGGDFVPLDEVEKRHILNALKRTGGHRTQAATLLGISIRTLRNKLNEYRVDVASLPNG